MLRKYSVMPRPIAATRGGVGWQGDRDETKGKGKEAARHRHSGLVAGAHRSTRSRPPFSITSFASIFVRRIGYALRKSGRASRLMVSCLLLSMPLPFYSSAHGNETERGAPAPVALSQDAAGNHVVHMSLAVTGGCVGGAVLGTVVPIFGNLVGCAVGGIAGWWFSRDRPPPPNGPRCSGSGAGRRPPAP